jgi:hypothetical protein
MLIFEYEGGWGYLARRKGVGGLLTRTLLRSKTRDIYGLGKENSQKTKIFAQNSMYNISVTSSCTGGSGVGGVSYI